MCVWSGVLHELWLYHTLVSSGAGVETCAAVSRGKGMDTLLYESALVILGGVCFPRWDLFVSLLEEQDGCGLCSGDTVLLISLCLRIIYWNWGGRLHWPVTDLLLLPLAMCYLTVSWP